jgi:hypothetical protein
MGDHIQDALLALELHRTVVLEHLPVHVPHTRLPKAESARADLWRRTSSQVGARGGVVKGRYRSSVCVWVIGPPVVHTRTYLRTYLYTYLRT